MFSKSRIHEENQSKGKQTGPQTDSDSQPLAEQQRTEKEKHKGTHDAKHEINDVLSAYTLEFH